MILAELRVRSVKTDPPGIFRVGAPLFSFLVSGVAVGVVVVERILVGGPAVVGLPGHVTALEQQVAGILGGVDGTVPADIAGLSRELLTILDERMVRILDLEAVLPSNDEIAA